jgi:hypothetical protein
LKQRRQGEQRISHSVIGKVKKPVNPVLVIASIKSLPPLLISDFDLGCTTFISNVPKTYCSLKYAIADLPTAKIKHLIITDD